jgi:glycosyltransferase involved in cell wall biosynthesis
MAQHLTKTAGTYALVHLVAQEADKDLVGPQVLDNAAAHLGNGAANAPAIVAAAFLEPVRHALSGRMRRRMRAHAARHPAVRTVLLPYVSRLSHDRNARLLARRIRSAVGRRPVVLHCRGESAVRWATALAPHLEPCAIVADIRGAWPEELVFARGFERVEDADAESRAAYRSALDELRRATASADAVSSVSSGMLEWLQDVGVARDKLMYVPCCVTGVAFDTEARARLRRRLGLEERLVFCYLGTITRYQHVPDGVLPFFRAATAADDRAHLLCLTPDVEKMRTLVDAAGIAPERVTIVSVPQREVAGHLSAADAGFLLRAPSPLNRYSQPTKLGEYLAAGLPVIVARGTGTVDALIEQAQAGVAVTAFGLREEELLEEARDVCRALGTSGAAWRANAIALCERHFVWGAYTAAAQEVYVQALREKTGTADIKEHSQ